VTEPATWPPANWIGVRVRQLRDARGWSAMRLAKRLDELGYGRMDRDVIANLENGRRRTVTVEDWLALALALDVAPVHLLVPPRSEDRLLVGHLEIDPDLARAWVRGETPHPEQDDRVFRTEVPDEEWRDLTGEEG
jgi:transcriptional regulator with XRE-family HTH domain